MSINGISGISGAARIAASTTSDEAASTAAARGVASGQTAASQKTDVAEEQPTPVHFPWLSRLSAELEAASQKRAPFSTQIMGDNLDKKA